MNHVRRKKLAEAVELLEKAKSIVEDVQMEEQDALFNLPEAFQYSEKGETMEENADRLSEIADTISDQVDEINDILGEISI